MTDSGYWKRNWVVVAVVFLLLITIFTRFYAIETIPVGADGDTMWISLDAADLVYRGVIPYFVDGVHSPDPTIVYLIAISQALFGVSMSTARIVTGSASVLLALLMIPILWEVLYEYEPRIRITAGILAMAAATSSLHAINIARLGHDAPVLPVAVALTFWLTAAAWYRGGWWRWLLAGIFLAWTQYIYLTGRFMGLVAPAWFIYSIIAHRALFKERWRGWIGMGALAFMLVLPNLILFVVYPESFSARIDSDPSSSAPGFIWDTLGADGGGTLKFLLQKGWNIILATGVSFHSKLLPMSTPVLSPLFFAGWWIGLGVSLVRIRRFGYGLLIVALPILLLGDLITSSTLDPTPMREVQMLPVHYALAGIGLVTVWQFLEKYTNRVTQIALVIILTVIGFAPMVKGYYTYVTSIVPELRANPDTSWRINQTDIDISNRILEQPEQSYLIPYGEYTRKTTAWLTLAGYPDRHSAVTGDGLLNIPNQPDELVVIQSTVPNRARHDVGIGLEWERWWVLLHDGQTLLLPPLDAEQTNELLSAVEETSSEELIDGSGQLVAEFYDIETPETLFATPEYTPLNVTLGKSVEGREAQLLGYTVYPSEPVAGEPMYVSLYWKPLMRLNENYEIFVQLWDDQAQVYGESHELPYESTYRTRIWYPDEITVTHHILFIKEDLPAQRYSLVMNFYRILQNEPLIALGQDAAPDQLAIMVDDFRIEPTQEAVNLDNLDSTIQFGDLLNIEHMEVQADNQPVDAFETWTVNPNQAIDIAIQWDVLDRLQLDYSYFVHLIPVDGEQPIAQFDKALEVNGLLGGAWRAGDSWFDMAHLQLPDDAPSGDYNLWLGVYYYADGTRLPIALDGEVQGEPRIVIGKVIVE